MTSASAATPAPAAPSRERLGLLLGLIGVLAFSLTLPMTRLAVGSLDAWFVAFGRMALAGLVAGLWLWLARAPRPDREQLPWLAGCVVGVVVGFPLCSSLAMRTLPANHGAVINGLLPFATALLAALWLGERHRARFWTCAAVGSAIVIAFALRHGVAVGYGHLWMLAAVLIGAVGYVAGGRLSRTMGGVNTILWSLVLALPLTLPTAAWLALATPMPARAAAWGAFAYITLISQIAGFFAWYNGLALGGIARVGQVQLLQAFFTIAAAAWLFGEQVEPLTWLAAAAVVATIAVGRTERASR
jgi:drug/metabolite transporter (DMT)-like permease